MSRRPLKRRATTFEWDTPTDSPPASQDAPRATVRIRHTAFSINDTAGPSSMQSTYITAPASPSKAPPPERVYQQDYLLYQMGSEPMEVDNGLGGEDDITAEDVVDPEYQEHLDEDAAGLPKPRQKRTQVRHQFNAISTLRSRFNTEESTSDVAR